MVWYRFRDAGGLHYKSKERVVGCVGEECPELPGILREEVSSTPTTAGRQPATPNYSRQAAGYPQPLQAGRRLHTSKFQLVNMERESSA